MCVCVSKFTKVDFANGKCVFFYWKKTHKFHVLRADGIKKQADVNKREFSAAVIAVQRAMDRIASKHCQETH